MFYKRSRVSSKSNSRNKKRKATQKARQWSNVSRVKNIKTPRINLPPIKDTRTPEEKLLDEFKKSQSDAQKAMKEQMDKMMKKADDMVAAMSSPEQEEGIKVDGISSSFASPKPSEREFQDQTAVDVDIDFIDDLEDLSMSALRPEIIAKFTGPYRSNNWGEGVGGRQFKDLFEGNLVRDQLSNDVYRKIYEHLEENAKDLLAAAAQRADDTFEITTQEVEVLTSYRSMIDDCLSALDLHECGVEIGELMLNEVSEILQVEDTLVENIPSNLEDLVIKLSNTKVELDNYFSNTKLYFSLLASIYEGMSGYSNHMGVASNSYKPFSFNTPKRSSYSLTRFKSLQAAQTSSQSKTVLNKGVSGIITPIREGSLTLDIQRLLCCLSNLSLIHI